MENSLNIHLQTVINVFVLYSFFMLTVMTLLVALGICNLLPTKFLNFAKTYIKLLCFFCSITTSGLVLLLKLFSHNMYAMRLPIFNIYTAPVKIYHTEQFFDIF